MVSDNIRAYRFAVPRRIAAGAQVPVNAQTSRELIVLVFLAVAYGVLLRATDRGRR